MLEWVNNINLYNMKIIIQLRNKSEVDYEVMDLVCRAMPVC